MTTSAGVQLPSIPAALPKSQGDWDRLTATLQVWMQRMAQGTPWLPVTLLNGWTSLNAGGNPAGFCSRLPDRVYLRGLIGAGTLTDATVLFTLPAGYAPAYEPVTIAQGWNGSVYVQVRVDVKPSGDVIIFGAAGIQWISLDQVSFSTLPPRAICRTHPRASLQHAGMTDPSATGSVKAAVERHGAGMVLLVFLRTYWKQVGGFIGAVFAVGVLYDQFRDMQKGFLDLKTAVDSQSAHIERQEGHLQSIDANILQIREKQTTQESRWNAVTTEASIVIQRKRPK